MMTRKDLQKRLGISEDQLYRLDSAIRPVLEARGLRGGSRGSAIQYDPQAISLFERAMELQSRGTALSDLVNALESELGGTHESHQNGHDEDARNSADPARMLVDELRERISEYQRREERWEAERQRLLAMLEGRDEQIRALMPGRSEDHTPAPDNGTSRMGRLQALRYAILGR
ncbi:MAG: hypothetical protein ABEL51_03690 [Salinibacter sp.]